MVAEVEFAELTRDGFVRQASFVKLREGKLSTQYQAANKHSAELDEQTSKIMGITISHPKRLVFPDDGVSKWDVVKYYERVGAWILPFVAYRPLAIMRALRGIGGELFFQKSFLAHIPKGVFQTKLFDVGDIFYVKNLAGLVWLGQFGAIEFHPWGAMLPDIHKPDFLTWDLDPDNLVSWDEVLGAAFLLRDVLAEHGLTTVVKTSGGKGLHIMLNIKRTCGWALMKAFTKAIAEKVAEMNPKRFTVNSSKAKRKGKIYIDYLRNAQGATCVAPWAVRARTGAPVSMPSNWNRLHEIDAKGFTIHDFQGCPTEWAELKPQTIPAKVLRDLGIS